MKTTSIGKIAAGSALTGALLLTGAGLVFAQTATTTGTMGPTYTGAAATGTDTTLGSSTAGVTGTTPGVPNTGAGGDAASNLAMLGVAALVAIGGAAYLSRKQFA